MYLVLDRRLSHLALQKFLRMHFPCSCCYVLRSMAKLTLNNGVIPFMLSCLKFLNFKIPKIFVKINLGKLTRKIVEFQNVIQCSTYLTPLYSACLLALHCNVHRMFLEH